MANKQVYFSVTCHVRPTPLQQLKKLSLELELTMQRAVRDLDRLEDWAEEEPDEVQQREMQSLHLWRNNLMHQYTLGAKQLA